MRTTFLRCAGHAAEVGVRRLGCLVVNDYFACLRGLRASAQAERLGAFRCAARLRSFRFLSRFPSTIAVK